MPVCSTHIKLWSILKSKPNFSSKSVVTTVPNFALGTIQNLKNYLSHNTVEHRIVHLFSLALTNVLLISLVDRLFYHFIYFVILFIFWSRPLFYYMHFDSRHPCCCATDVDVCLIELMNGHLEHLCGLKTLDSFIYLDETRF